MGDRDVDDWPFVALAIAAGYPIWTNDCALLSQERVRTFTTEDFVRGRFVQE